MAPTVARGRRQSTARAIALAGAVLTALVVSLGAQAQQAGRVYRVGYMTVPSRETAEAVANTFQQALRDLGWVDGRNIAVDFRYADSRVERLPEIADEFVRLKEDVIVAGANAAVTAARNATRTTPIVMFLATDPVGSGLVSSLARPGANVTGFTITAGPEFYGKQLQLLKSAFPRVTRVAVLANPRVPLYAHVQAEIEEAARTLGLQRQIVEVRGPSEFDRAFATLTAAHADAIFAPADSMFYQHRVRLAQLAAKTRLPAMWGLGDHALAGGLMSYSTDLHDLARRAAAVVDRILKGAKPADIPVEQPTKFELIVNAKTAKAMGLTIPPSLLQRADRVID